MFESLRRRKRKVTPTHSRESSTAGKRVFDTDCNKQMAGGGGKFMQKIEVCKCFAEYN